MHLTKLSEPEIIKKDGTEFAVVPYTEYMVLIEALEDLEDIQSVINSKNEESFPADVVYRLCDGENPVKVWRKYRGLKQKELAREVGLHPSQISLLERGKRNMSVKTLKKVASALNIGTDDLLGDY